MSMAYSVCICILNYSRLSTNIHNTVGMFYLYLEGNFLIRKRCYHTDKFDCDCNQLEFDVLLMDYDYVHTEGTEIQDPTHTGTYQYRALPLLVCTYVYI